MTTYKKNFFPGEVAELEMELLSSGIEVDPGSLKVTVLDPLGNQTVFQYGVDPELAKVDTGNYKLSLPVVTAGIWSWRAFAGSPEQCAREGTFKVLRSIVRDVN